MNKKIKYQLPDNYPTKEFLHFSELVYFNLPRIYNSYIFVDSNGKLEKIRVSKN